MDEMALTLDHTLKDLASIGIVVVVIHTTPGLATAMVTLSVCVTISSAI